MDGSRLGTSVIVVPVERAADGLDETSAFAAGLADLLSRHGQPVKMIFADICGVGLQVATAYSGLLSGRAFEILSPVPGQIPPGYERFQYVTEQVAASIAGIADVAIIYCIDRWASGVVAVRRKRTSLDGGAPIVTVMLGSSAERRASQALWPSSLEEMQRDASERYAAENSDFVICQGATQLDWHRRQGWSLSPDRTRLMDFSIWAPDDARPGGTSAALQWLAFHRAAVVSKQQTSLPRRNRVKGKRVDICLPNFNLGHYLPMALSSLAEQTCDDFNVFVLDDGSSQEGEQKAFQQIAGKFARPNWRFERQQNAGVCTTRNRLAAMGDAELIIWMDPDNVAVPNMVERFIEGIDATDDDVLTCYNHHFTGDGLPFIEGSRVPLPGLHCGVHVGGFPLLALVSNPFGDLHSIMRRAAFEASGGFSEGYPKEVNHEDLELFVRMALQGFRIDVIPEFLCYYRVRPNSRVRTTPKYESQQRVLDAYRAHLAPLGMADVASYLVGTNQALAATRQAMSASRNLATEVRASELFRALLCKVARRLGQR